MRLDLIPKIGSKDEGAQTHLYIQQPWNLQYLTSIPTIMFRVGPAKSHDNVFISGGNPHLKSQFCGVVLGPTMISKMVSELLQDPLSHMLSGFCHQATHHLCPRTKPNSASHEGVC